MTRWLPLVRTGPRPAGAHPLAGGWCWFESAERLTREGRERVPAAEVPAEAMARFVAPRPPLMGRALDRPRIMGILNATPDSFSDGGLHDAPWAARAVAARLVAEGADIVDLGGESTRPGAIPVPSPEEWSRVAPVLEEPPGAPISIDTRNASTARAALAEGVGAVNDVSGLAHDPAMAGVVARSGAALVLMHARGTPETMQDMAEYDDVTLDVLDEIEARLEVAEAAGIDRARIVIDPGIGFGKRLGHNLQLLRDLAAFHAFGCPLLVGLSRKGMIGALSGERDPALRAAGSVAGGLTALARGAQILRVHDVAAHVQAVRVWTAVEAPGIDWEDGA